MSKRLDLLQNILEIENTATNNVCNNISNVIYVKLLTKIRI